MPTIISGLTPVRVQHAGLDGRRGDDQHAGHRQEGEARGERREAEVLLQEVGEKQKHAEDARAGERDRRCRRRRARGPRRCAAAATDVRRVARSARTRPAARAGDERDDRRRRAPRMGLGVGESVHEREQPADAGQDARDVDARPVGIGVVDSSRSATIAVGTAITRLTYRHQRHDSTWVSAPPSTSPTDAPPPAIAPKIPNALARSGRPGEGDRQQRQRRGREQRAERPLQRPRGDEHAEGLRQAAERRGQRKARQPRDERPLAAEQITELAAQQQQTAERQRVGGDDPLAARRSRNAAPAGPRAARWSRSSRRAPPSAARRRAARARPSDLVQRPPARRVRSGC